MEPRYIVWERLVVYREELIRLCERVSLEMAENRARREAWLAWTESWKQHRLTREQESPVSGSGSATNELRESTRASASRT